MIRNSLKSILDKKNKKKITCLTAYTTSIAKIIDDCIDIILIGDSVGTAIYGMKNTQSVNLDMMMHHGKTVVNSTRKAFTMIDMPFNTYRNKKEALINSKKLLKYTKCQSIKLEADFKTVDIVKHLKKSNIKIISHIGVTPQRYKHFKKIKSVGKSNKEKYDLLNLAIQLEKAGSSMIVLECMKESVAKEITNTLTIPTIGIGASPACDGQILVINDILNTENLDKQPRFVKTYVNINEIIKKAVKKYSQEVRNKKFPKIENTY